MVSFDILGDRRNMNNASPRIDGRDRENGRSRYIAIDRTDASSTSGSDAVSYGGGVFPDCGTMIQFLASLGSKAIYMKFAFYPFVGDRAAGE